MKKKLIFVELNEINFDLVEKYLKDTNFEFFNKNFFKELRNTFSEDNYDNLEPWIQWVSVHTGMDAKGHKIFRLGDINNQKLDQIFELIEAKGYSVGAICPMNATNRLKETKYFIPDPWTKSKSNSSYLQNLIYEALSEAVNNNSGSKLSLKSKIVILFSFFLFIKKTKLFYLARLIIKSFKKKWYKAIVFDYLLHNIHLNYLKKYKADFSTIFFNAGAHIQHHYLHNSKKINSNLKKNPSWYVPENLDPILDVYSFYDNIIPDYLKFEEYSILIATGLSQNPHKEKNFYYRIKNHENFLKLIGVDFKTVEPRMSRDFLINFENIELLEKSLKIFQEINHLNNEKIFEIDCRNKSIFVSLIFNKEIKNFHELIIKKNHTINLYKHVNFVAIKNGEHRSKGYVMSFNDIKNYFPKNDFHVKDLFKTINNYFG
tara:strand:- start:199 stop:1491 length:1293 start_codon:yes stop_codon:yes gene_type:complete